VELLHTEPVAIRCTSVFGFTAPLPSAVAEAVENVNAGSCRNHGAPPSRRQIILIARANRQARDRRREALLAHRLGQKYG